MKEMLKKDIIEPWQTTTSLGTKPPCLRSTKGACNALAVGDEALAAPCMEKTAGDGAIPRVLAGRKVAIGCSSLWNVSSSFQFLKACSRVLQ
jgi:hypothetical protein